MKYVVAGNILLWSCDLSISIRHSIFTKYKLGCQIFFVSDVTCITDQ